MGYLIEDYAIIGDGRTVALISSNGDMGWLCLPQLDSPACFASLLGNEEHGRWHVTIPEAQVSNREYYPSSFVLQTSYEGPHGKARITEWMDTSTQGTHIVRRVECTAGRVQVLTDLVVRFGYGKVVPWATRVRDPDKRDVLRFIAGPDALTLHAPTLPHGHDHRHEDLIDLVDGQSEDFVMTWSHSWDPVPALIDVDASLKATLNTWRSWCAEGDVGDSYDGHIRRSLLTLRALTNVDTGGVAAAATTSLPEEFGGERNWDYRFCWLRDSALTLTVLVDAGFVDEAEEWREWLLRAIAGDPSDIQVMYGLDGRRDLPEYTLPFLPGYESSVPVRVGNAASTQVQNDVFGEVLGALAAAREAGLTETSDSWALQRHLANALLDSWREPDHGIWEIRGPKQHFTHSKIMCWHAIDRALSAITDHDLRGPRQKWEKAREEIREDVLTHGVDPHTGSLVQHYETTEVDASLLMVCQTNFLPANDHRIEATVRRIAKELSHGVHVARYRTQTGVDGLHGEENHFYACSFWLVEALARIGRLEEATQRFQELLDTSNDVALFAEEYDVDNCRFAGNFPQALSHLALVGAATSLRKSRRAMNGGCSTL